MPRNASQAAGADTAAAAALAADGDVSATAGRVIGATSPFSVAALLQPGALHALRSVPLALPLRCTALPAATQAAVARCLAAGPPPPPPAVPAPGESGKKGSAAASATPVPAAPAGPPPPGSAEAAAAALFAKCRPAVAGSVALVVLDIRLAALAPGRTTV